MSTILFIKQTEETLKQFSEEALLTDLENKQARKSLQTLLENLIEKAEEHSINDVLKLATDGLSAFKLSIKSSKSLCRFS